jgi:hypothetical protein
MHKLWARIPPGIGAPRRMTDNTAEDMGTFATTFRSGLHLLTAAMTLFAGLPAFECRCAGAPTAIARPGPGQTTCGCGECCGGGEARAAEGNSSVSVASADDEQSCCCQRRAAKSEREDGRPRGNTCTRVAVRTSEYLSCDAGSLVVGGTVHHLVPPTQPLTLTCRTDSPARADWLSHPPGPPRELLPLLQRFLI